MRDVNKKNRKSLWVAFSLSLVAALAVRLFDGQQISEKELATIQNLTLSDRPFYHSNRGQRIIFTVINTKKTLVLNLAEIRCVDPYEIINTFKSGDTISVKVYSSDVVEFYNPTFIKRFQKIYGLTKNNRQFVELSCRNKFALKNMDAATYASISSAILSFVLAVFVYKSKTSQQAVRQLKMDPTIFVCLCWLLVVIIFMFR